MELTDYHKRIVAALYKREDKKLEQTSLQGLFQATSSAYMRNRLKQHLKELVGAGYLTKTSAKVGSGWEHTYRLTEEGIMQGRTLTVRATAIEFKATTYLYKDKKGYFISPVFWDDAILKALPD